MLEFLTQTAVVNKELGSQTIHLENNGRTNKNLLTLPNAIKGFYDKYISAAEQFGCKLELEAFLLNWVQSHLLNVLKFQKLTAGKEDRKFTIKLYKNIMKKYHFFKKSFVYFYLCVNFPTAINLYNQHKWILERRNFRLLTRKINKLIKST